MALTVKGYMGAMQNRQRVIARALGVDITRMDKQTRVVVLSLLALLAVLIKTLTDKGVITDGELVATLDAARDDEWTNQPNDPPTED